MCGLVGFCVSQKQNQWKGGEKGTARIEPPVACGLIRGESTPDLIECEHGCQNYVFGWIQLDVMFIIFWNLNLDMNILEYFECWRIKKVGVVA